MNGHLILRGLLRRNPVYPLAPAVSSSCSSSPCIISRYYSGQQGATRDPYDVLGLHRRATKKEIKSAYIRLSKLYHPDRNQQNPSAAAKEFHELREAYEELISRPQQSEGTTEHTAREAPPSWQEGGAEYTRNDYEFSQGRRRVRTRSFDDWIKEVERNARLRKKQAQSSKNGSNSEESTEGRQNYHYSSSPIFPDKYKFWKPSPIMERDYARCETRILAELDKAYKHFMIKDRLESEIGRTLAQRGFSKLTLLYILLLKVMFRIGAKLVFCLVGLLLALEMSYDE
jgi:hypothetical protein